MRIDEHIAALRHEGGLTVEAVDRADLDAVPPTCPDWTVRELAHHLGRVQRWAATYVRQARTTMMTDEEHDQSWGAMPADDRLIDWLREGTERLVDVLEHAPPGLECWSFLPAPSPLAFWARRQAHEAAIHRVDAQLAAGPADHVARAFAVDGIDELLLCFFRGPRNRVRLDEPRRLAIIASDADVSWMIHIGPDGAQGE